MALFSAAPRLSAQLPMSALSVRREGGEEVWWRSADAPQRWPTAMPAVAQAVQWRTLQPGLEYGHLELAGDGVSWRIAVVLARLDPARFRLELDARYAWNGGAAWTIGQAGTAALAVNAGQFQGGSPWGWVVHRGEELQPPGSGPLSAALVLDRNGRIDMLAPDEIATARASGRVAEAIQSYPAILVGDGEVPEQLRAPNRGVNLGHRDSRLGACVMRDGSLLFALTRFLSPTSPLSRLPFGPTTPEMAALMGALGCRRAVLLDGGLSAQMAFGADGESLRWPGLRAVPLGLTVRPR
jgi:exopolysaccharide biosynthesis protein